MARTRSRSKSRSKGRGKRTRMVRGKRCWSGGAQLVFPAPVENASYESSFSSPSKMMLSQGGEYESLHAGQHGGAVAFNPSPAPPGYTGVLEDGLRGQAFLNPLDQSLQAIQGMSDQAGGARRRRRRTGGGSRKGTKRGRKGTRRMRGRKGSRRGRKDTKRMRGGNNSQNPSAPMNGGAATSLASAQEFGAPGMLLSPGQEQAALGGMNPEWKLATDPNAFTPR